VLVKELQSLGLALEVINEEEVKVAPAEETVDEGYKLEAETDTSEKPRWREVDNDVRD
jgi:hypothetical protein